MSARELVGSLLRTKPAKTLKREFANPNQFYREQMTVKYTRIFTITGAITREPVTNFTPKFDELVNFTCMDILDAQRLTNALIELLRDKPGGDG